LNLSLAECAECDYYCLVHGQKPSIIILGKNKRIIRDWDEYPEFEDYRIWFTETEYECARMIERIRPDFIVVDYALGKKYTDRLFKNILNDERMPIVRIIMTSRNKPVDYLCDSKVFGWITRPFTIKQLESCIEGVAQRGIEIVERIR
jgi:AmiR/NasT family two-component response regulator